MAIYARRLVAALMFTALILLAACGSATPVPTVSTADNVRVQFSWLHSVTWASFYMAEDKGYYGAENLDVTLAIGGFDADGNFIDPLQQVASGAAQFGIVDTTLLLPARAQGMPVVAIATIFQRHPLALTSLAESNIVSPQDLIGKTVQLSGNSTVVFQALLHEEGIDPADVNVVERTDFTINPLLNHEADVIDAWVNNEIVTLSEGDYAFNMILPADYGIEVYPNVIFTTEDMIANQPEVVTRFLRATLHGTQDTIDDAQSAAQLAVGYMTGEGGMEVDTNVQTISMEQSLPLLMPTGSRVGNMEPEVWEFTHQVLLDQGILIEPLDDIHDAYTTSFLETIYGEE
jgi:ABC-type nitrate/sulfonate/bicarbonate transport system substrate-binding protein